MKLLTGFCLLHTAAMAATASNANMRRSVQKNGEENEDYYSSANIFSAIEKKHKILVTRELEPLKISNDMFPLDHLSELSPKSTQKPTTQKQTPTVSPSVAVDPTEQTSSGPSSVNQLSPSEIVFQPTTVQPSASPIQAKTLKQPSASPTTNEPSTKKPSASPIQAPSLSPIKHPSASPTTNDPPTVQPSTSPTRAPKQPSASPTQTPSSSPVKQPSANATTNEPSTVQPSASPIQAPSSSPVKQPSASPTTHEPSTVQPSASPIQAPSSSPVKQPSASPTTNEPSTVQPSASPTTNEPSTKKPSASPIQAPSSSPVKQPSASPTTNEPSTVQPSASPIQAPSLSPIKHPSESPTTNDPPTVQPSASPIQAPKQPSASPTQTPSSSPVKQPSANATTNEPSTKKPSASPIQAPSSSPVKQPSASPTTNEPSTVQPSASPIQAPSSSPVKQPSASPTTNEPSTVQPSAKPTPNPSVSPTPEPSVQPTYKRSVSPTPEPSEKPTPKPSASPTPGPSVQPTFKPSVSKSDLPSAAPTLSIASALETGDTTSPPHSSLAPTFVTVLPKMKFTLFETQDVLSDNALSSATLAIEQFFRTQLDKVYNDDGRSLSDYFYNINLEVVNFRLVFRDMPSDELVRHLRQRRRQSESMRGTEIIYDGTASFFDRSPSSSSVAKTMVATSIRFNDYLVSNITTTGNPDLVGVYVLYVEQYEAGDENEVKNLLPTLNSETIELNEGTRAAIIIMTAAGVTTFTMLALAFASRRRNSHRNERNSVPLRASVPITTRPPPSGSDLSIISSLTEMFPTSHNDKIVQGDKARSQNENMPKENAVRSSERSLMTAAEINCRGTMLLENGDASRKRTSYGDKANTKLLVSTESVSQRALGTVSVVDASEASVEPSENGFRPISPSSILPYSIIDTAATEEEHVTSKTGGFPTFGITSAPFTNLPDDDLSSTSNESMRSVSTSGSQFIRDLIWIENRISLENSPKKSLGEKKRIVPMTIATNERSEAMSSVACRDCFIPSGALLDGIDIISTSDGPVLKSIAEGSVLHSHATAPARIVSVDGFDTRNSTADFVISLLASTSTPIHKLTVLHFGSSDC